MKKSVNELVNDSARREMRDRPRGGGLGRVTLVLLFILLLIGFAWAFKSYWQVKKQLASMSSGQNQQMSEEEIGRIIGKVGKIILLPSDEKPMVAVVNNITKLLESEPVFYKNSQNGDYVLIYEKAKKAYIYREKDNKIINDGPITIEDTAKTPEDSGNVKKVEENAPSK